MPQLAMAARYQGRSNWFRRWAYQAKVIKMFDRINSPAVRKKIEVLICPSWLKRSWELRQAACGYGM